MRKIRTKTTGFIDKNRADCNGSVANEFGLSDEQIEELKWLWSKAYKRAVTTDEVLEIVANIKYFMEVLL